MVRRTCPWCGVTRVYGFTEESVVRALTTHLASCGEEGEELPEDVA
jgi:hypothetical protein